MTILVTGSAGFIGFHLVSSFLNNGINVVGVDNLNDYYDVSLKKLRLKKLEELADIKTSTYDFYKQDICDRSQLFKIFSRHKISCIVHLAAQAGVRYSITNPDEYINSNIVGFHNILEASRKFKINHLIFASSSSVYGMSTDIPFSAGTNTDAPISLYAASKKSNELMAFSYSHLYNIQITGLRFFTVYGPYGRPDMAYFKFVKSIDSEEEIEVYNNGDMKRDFTYIDDIIEGINLIVENPPKNIQHHSSLSKAPYRIFNIGNNKPVLLSTFIKIIEKNLNKNASKKFLPMQDGDVPITYADIDDLKKEYSFEPKTSIEKGLRAFIEWYKSNY